MKISLSVAILVGSAACITAFQQPTGLTKTLPLLKTTLFANSKNIRAARDATDQFGATSPESRLAWEVVEEFDSNDNSAAFEVNEENRMSDEALARANEELYASMEVVQRLIEYRQYNQLQIRAVTAELQAIKLTPPEKKPAPQIAGLWDAKLKARAMSQINGNDSPEARLAWEEVEELASSGLDNAMGDDMTQECLIQAAEACAALEELERFLTIPR